MIKNHPPKGSYCAHCKTETPTSIHGRCECGYQKFYSKTLSRRNKPDRPFIIRPKLEDMDEIKKIMRRRPSEGERHMRR